MPPGWPAGMLGVFEVITSSILRIISAASLADFKACGMSARGWAVLAYDTNDGRLHNYIGDTHNQGGVWGAIPVIVLDVYEHAYFIDYGSDRKSYLEDFMNHLDWKMANEVWGKIKGLRF